MSAIYAGPKCPRCGARTGQTRVKDRMYLACTREACTFVVSATVPSAIPEAKRAPQKRYAMPKRREEEGDP